MLKPYAIGIDVGGTKIAAGLVNYQGQILQRFTTRAHSEQQPEQWVPGRAAARHRPRPGSPHVENAATVARERQQRNWRGPAHHTRRTTDVFNLDFEPNFGLTACAGARPLTACRERRPRQDSNLRPRD